MTILKDRNESAIRAGFYRDWNDKRGHGIVRVYSESTGDGENVSKIKYLYNAPGTQDGELCQRIASELVPISLDNARQIARALRYQADMIEIELKKF